MRYIVVYVPVALSANSIVQYLVVDTQPTNGPEVACACAAKAFATSVAASLNA